MPQLRRTEAMGVIRSAAMRRAAAAASASAAASATPAAAAAGIAAGQPAAPLRRKAGRPRLDSLCARHDDILAIALTLFIEHGYANVTLAMLAASAHMAVRTIYVKFGNKEGLLAALVDAERERHRVQLEQLALDSLGFHARLPLLAQHIARRGGEQRLLYLQAIVLAEASQELARDFYDAAPGLAIAALQATLEDGLRLGVIRAGLSLSILCELFISCIGGNRTTLWQPKAPDNSRWQSGLALFLSAVT